MKRLIDQMSKRAEISIFFGQFTSRVTCAMMKAIKILGSLFTNMDALKESRGKKEWSLIGFEHILKCYKFVQCIKNELN